MNQTILFSSHAVPSSELYVIKYSFREGVLGLNWIVLYLERQKLNGHQGF